MGKKKRVLIISPQASRIGHGALHTQRNLAAFADQGEWDTILLTGKGFRQRTGDLPIFGEIIEAPVDFNRVEAYRGTISALRWGLERRLLQQRLLAVVDKLLDSEKTDVILALDGDVGAIHACWKRNKKKHPHIGWVTAHGVLDFWFKSLSVRSLFKWYAGFLVKQMIEQMDSTILYADEELCDETFRRLNIPARYKEKIILTDFGCDPDDMRLPKTVARQQLGIPDDVPVALFFGLLRADKRPDLAISAVSEAGPPWWLLMAGKPYSYSVDDIQNLVDKEKITERSSMILRYFDEDEIPYILSSADLMLMTHERKTLSNSGNLGLARSYRLPVVINGECYLGKKVHQDGTGIICSNGEASSFAKGLNKFTDMTNEERKIIYENIERSAHHNSFISVIHRYSKALDIALNNI
jgi:glycosyltransferase involved in cell wall biosynthesis